MVKFNPIFMINISSYAGWPWLSLTLVGPLSISLITIIYSMTRRFRLQNSSSVQQDQTSPVNSTSLKIADAEDGGSPVLTRISMDGSHQQMIFSGSSDNGVQDKTEFTFALLLNGLSLFLQVPRLICNGFEATYLLTVLECLEAGVDITPVWLLYVATLSQVCQGLFSSVNLLVVLASNNERIRRRISSIWYPSPSSYTRSQVSL
ncbi:uncharacterized protein LOC111711645 [Eurytemora carolleeae]|uniref:uncharacterized protein LOC111711645 n=1 Tax=Eurytemora carolleeae TaxID=1294199 RepID=UPI000C760323|nr:uncharacterized protein LOC111711645 [Eurytemora carolleeae]|eukprot:XP_023341804.1 uncharacterized protein LOC111711645 [Eurytemora affinis]